MSEPLHIVCPHCASINRVPAERLEQKPQCGHCHQPLFTGHPIELTSANFESHIRRSAVPLVVDFWASWCGPCQMMAPHFQRAALELEPRIRLAKVNTDEQQALGAQFAIRSIPTMVLFKEGREMARHSGAMSSSDIVRWIRSQLPPA